MVIFEDFFYDFEEFYGIILKDCKIQFDMCEVFVCIVDGFWFYEYQFDYGMMLICGFVYIWGYKVGIFVNNGVLFNDSLFKVVYFMQLCNQN